VTSGLDDFLYRLSCLASAIQEWEQSAATNVLGDHRHIEQRIARQVLWLTGAYARHAAVMAARRAPPPP